MVSFNLFSRGPKRYISEDAFQKKRASQVAMTPETMTQLRKYGVTDESALKLEYFFYTNAATKAAQLADALEKKGYSVEHGPSAHDKRVQVVTGWTKEMPMTDAVVVAWTREMCELGFAHDCEFDGWGTNPKP